MRAALESDFASENIHHWIDLIFRYKQTGEEAEKADNGKMSTALKNVRIIRYSENRCQ